MQQTKAQLEAQQLIGLGILEAVNEAGDIGAPGGVLYAALMAHGASLSQYQSFMLSLTSRNMLTTSGDIFYITDAGQRLMTQLQQKFKH